MIKAVVLVTIDAGREEEAMSNISKIEEVKKAFQVYGVYDVVAEVEGKSLDDIREVIVKKVRRVPGVRSTITMIVIKEFSK